MKITKRHVQRYIKANTVEGCKRVNSIRRMTECNARHILRVGYLDRRGDGHFKSIYVSDILKYIKERDGK